MYGEGVQVDKNGNAMIVYEAGKSGSYDETNTIDINKIIEEHNGKAPSIEGISSDYDKGDPVNPQTQFRTNIKDTTGIVSGTSGAVSGAVVAHQVLYGPAPNPNIQQVTPSTGQSVVHQAVYEPTTIALQQPVSKQIPSSISNVKSYITNNSQQSISNMFEFGKSNTRNQTVSYVPQTVDRNVININRVSNQSINNIPNSSTPAQSNINSNINIDSSSSVSDIAKGAALGLIGIMGATAALKKFDKEDEDDIDVDAIDSEII